MVKLEKALAAYIASLQNLNPKLKNALDRFQPTLCCASASNSNCTLALRCVVADRRKWFTPDMLKAKRWIEQRVKKLGEFFAHHAFLKNANYQALFEVPRYRATAELQRLVGGGLSAAGRRAARDALPARAAAGHTDRVMI